MTHTQRNAGGAIGQLGLLALVLLTSTGAMADSTGWYGGATIGQSQASIDDAHITSGLFANGLTAGGINAVNRDLGLKIFGGYHYSKHLALEAGYFDLGRFAFSTNTTPVGSYSGEVKLKGLNLDAIGMLPINEKFSAFGRIGITHTQANAAFAGTGAVNVANPNPSSNETNLKVGLGLQYILSEDLSVRAELERYRINDAVGNQGDVDLLSVGLVYRFGNKKPSAMAR